MSLFTGSALGAPCPASSEFEPGYKYCIWVGPAAPFFTADTYCRSLGGYLLVIDSHIHNYLKYNSTLRYLLLLEEDTCHTHLFPLHDMDKLEDFSNMY